MITYRFWCLQVLLMLFVSAATGQSWSLTGNDITGSNFIGAIGAGDELIFKTTPSGGTATEYLRITNKGLFYIYNQGVGNHFLGFQSGVSLTNGTYNTSLGYQALKSNTAGSNNTAFGYLALQNVTTSNFNTAVGSNSLKSNTTGSNNLGFGYQSLFSNSTASYNLGFGASALYSNITGSNNLAIGYQALYSNTTATYNLAIGNSALYSNTIGIQNIAIGQSALYDNNTGSNNIAIGKFSDVNNLSGSDNVTIGTSTLFWNSSGANNIAIGTSALLNYTSDNTVAIGYLAGENLTDGSGNVIIGYKSLNQASTSSFNTAVGFEALTNHTTNGANAAFGYRAGAALTYGHSNTVIGYRAMENMTTSSDNVGIGHEAGLWITTGSGNNFVGSNTGGSITSGDDNTFMGNLANASGNFSNSGAFGSGAITTASNKIWIGNSIAEVWTQINFYVSDQRFKTNVKNDIPGLEFILALTPVSYEFQSKKLDEFKANGNDQVLSLYDNLDYSNSNQVMTGFIAQDVAEIAENLGFNFCGVSKPKNDLDVYGLDYSLFVVPLVQAMQEQQNLINALSNKIVLLSEELETIKANSSDLLDNKVSDVSVPKLFQNKPNPFSQKTIIEFYIPEDFTNAKILVTDLSGKAILTFNITTTGQGYIELETENLPKGLYLYSLICNFAVVDTKNMTIID